MSYLTIALLHVLEHICSAAKHCYINFQLSFVSVLQKLFLNLFPLLPNQILLQFTAVTNDVHCILCMHAYSSITQNRDLKKYFYENQVIIKVININWYKNTAMP